MSDREVWLRGNTRAVGFAAAVPLAVLAVGLIMASGLFGRVPSLAVRLPGIALSAASAWLLAVVLWQVWRPRLVYEDGCLLFHVRADRPIRVPIDVVEGFLLGRSPVPMPGKHVSTAESSNLVVRLSERAAEWERVEVKHALASWCGHYVTIRGTWCEPLSVELANRLNARLAEVKLRDVATNVD